MVVHAGTMVLPSAKRDQHTLEAVDQIVCHSAILDAISKERPMADLKDQKPADSLATLPTAKEIMEQIARKEAEKASAAVRELSAARPRKRH